MAVDWTDDERARIVQGIATHGLTTGRCAALARIVFALAQPRDEHAHGAQLQPPSGARWLVPKAPHVPYWGSHTYVVTERHAVDAVVGPDGYEADRFVRDHWEFWETIRVSEVDPATVDPGIEDMERGNEDNS